MTLVELVLAVGMFSFLMASVGHLALTSLRVQRSWGGLVMPAQSAERALSRLAHDLQAAQPLFGVPFQVMSDGAGLEFARLDMAAGADGRPTAAWRRVVYRMEPDGDAKRLVREEWLWKTGEANSEPISHETLSTLGAGRFTVGMMNEDDLLEWTASWDGEADGMPRLIKLEATLPATGTGQPITLSRVIRNPSGTLPKPEPP